MDPASPLLKLPGEIRNRIYALVATDDEPVKIRHLGTIRQTEKEDEVEDVNDVEHVEGNCAGLTRVGRQIREEYLPIYRQHAVVVMPAPQVDQWLMIFNEAHPIKGFMVNVSFTWDGTDDFSAQVKWDRH
ncbi:hypothetical protein P171DRAFT_431049 [Karstenula rhodostoma CBS 690.94]|uniref:Uncharacterized protein n=1 Tax=Karstenula rhodostoma CBS 690.94 TaxID=1392251 RepID=A0A9P4UDR1_9PLEO|nr:hypothetical protein P171DRAFT_431049 [Karstenula rhodostoma CBS 690.94]